MNHYFVTLAGWLPVIYIVRNNWDLVLDSGYTDFQIFVWGTTFLSGFILFGAGAFFWLLETLFPRFVAPYKSQPKIVNSTEEVLSMIPLVAFNLFVACALLVLGYSIHPEYINLDRNGLPSLSRFFAEVFVFACTYDILFYLVHRAMHISPFLYQMIHKRNHRFLAPSSFSSTYAHPLEHIFANLIPISLGPLLLHAHLSTTWCWLALGLWLTTCDHSGFDFPGLSHTRIHDLHHHKLNVNFGSPGLFMDRLFGTFEDA